MVSRSWCTRDRDVRLAKGKLALLARRAALLGSAVNMAAGGARGCRRRVRQSVVGRPGSWHQCDVMAAAASAATDE